MSLLGFRTFSMWCVYVSILRHTLCFTYKAPLKTGERCWSRKVDISQTECRVITDRSKEVSLLWFSLLLVSDVCFHYENMSVQYEGIYKSGKMVFLDVKM